MTRILTGLTDREGVIETVNALFAAVDGRDWATARIVLADRVHFDVTSLGGAAAQELDAEEIISGWAAGLASIEAIHHQSGTFRVQVDGNVAECACYGTAYHYRRVRSGKNTRLFVGSYDYRLERTDSPWGWRITGFRFNLKFVEGNLKLGEEEPA